jgi:hypothetical protein
MGCVRSMQYLPGRELSQHLLEDRGKPRERIWRCPVAGHLQMHTRLLASSLANKIIWEFPKLSLIYFKNSVSSSQKNTMCIHCKYLPVYAV